MEDDKQAALDDVGCDADLRVSNQTFVPSFSLLAFRLIGERLAYL